MIISTGGMEADLQDNSLWRLLALTAVIHLIFSIWPTLDIATSQYFVLPDGTFWLAKSTLAEEVRMPIWLASVALAILSVVMLCASLLLGRMAQTSWRLWAFIATTYIVGPGLLVNVILKQNWGRARPVTVEQFGGTQIFTPPFEIAGQCASNCSFVSGEAASAAVMVVVLAVCFRNSIPKQWRLFAYTGLGTVFLVASGLRVATGRHFLSDVIFAGLFMLIISRIAYRTFTVKLPSATGFFGAMRADISGAIATPWRIVRESTKHVESAVVPIPVSEKTAKIRRHNRP